MKKIYMAFAALLITLGANAQGGAYTLDAAYRGTGYYFANQVQPGNDNGYATAIRLNNDGSEYVAVQQYTNQSIYSIAALVKNRANGLRDSSFATNGLASNLFFQDARLYDIAFIENDSKIYCSGSGWGGYVWNGSAILSQMYGGGTVAPGLYCVDGCKMNDSVMVQISITNDIIFVEDNGNETYGYIAYSNPVYYTIGGQQYAPVFNKITSVPGSSYWVAGVVDSFAFISKYIAGGFFINTGWGDNGLVKLKMADVSSPGRFNDIVIQADGKVLALYEGTLAGDQSATKYLMRFNADGSPDVAFGTNGMVKQTNIYGLCALPNGNIAASYTYDFAATHQAGILLFDGTTGALLSANYAYALPTASGYQQAATVLAITCNSQGHIALCGSVTDSATGVQKPFIMRLKYNSCMGNINVIATSNTSLSGTVTGIALPATVYIAPEGYEGAQFSAPLDATNTFMFGQLNTGENYMVVIEDANGCSYTLYADLANPTVGINDIEATSISIYPNPAHNVLNIATGYEVEAVQIAGIQGNVVYQQQGNSKQIAVANLQPGIYIARVTLANGRSVVARFTKQ